MSGDTHVRKRGADKRRKKVEEVVEEPVPLLIPASEENIHVHKDAHLGGNFCSKIVFFCLFGTLAVLVGLLIIEFQGSGDVESATDSPWSVMLEGWVDDQLDAHDHEEHSSLADHSGEEEEEESENEVEFSIYGVSEPEEEEQSHENEDEEEDPAVNDDKEIEANEQENFGFYKSLYASIYSTKDDDSEKGDEGEDGSPEESDKNVEGDDDDGNAEDDEDKNEEDDDDGSAEDDNNDDNLNNDNDDEEEEVGSEQEDAGDIFGEKNDDDYFGSNNDVDADDPKEDSGENNEDEETESEKNHNFFKKTDSRGSNDEIEDDNNDDDVDDELIQRILTKSHEKKHRFENIREKAYETGAEENIRKVMNGLRKKKLEEDVSQEIVDEEPLEGVEEKVTSEENVEEEKEEAAQEQVIDDDDNEETVGVILKFGVGVALIVVAHVVLIKKWNSWDSGSSADINQTADNKEDLPDEVPVTDRRESLVDENATLPAPSGSEDEVEDESQHTGDTTPEESDEEPATERYSSNKAYTQLSETPPESEGEESNVGSSDGEREVDVSTQRWETNFSNEEVEAETGTEEEETEDEEEEEENEPSEDEEPPPPPPRPEPTYTRRRGGPRSSDVEFEEEYYQYSDVSNEYDWAIRNELDFAEDEFLNGSLENSKLLFSEILTKHPNSVRASYGVAKCFDQMAENLKSNTHLLQAIDAYTRALEMPNVTDILYLQMVNRTIERMRFKGLYEKLILLHGNVVRRFPNEPTHRTQMAITFLLMNRLNDAKTVLENVLNRWPEDGAAAAHYGFILKLENNLVEGVKYLKAGLDSNHSGAQDSRFYFHLGDALLRLGRKDEALQIHENGVSKGMFRSVYQRSLYNVDRLSAQPWWTLGETTYQKFFRKLEENWKMIRKEALAVIKKQTEFQDEAENLRDAGDWKQFELFARGRKNTGNCQKVPVTCGIVSIFEPASSCTRGQVKFSAMMPGTHVWPHCGPTNCRLRAHLGLVVPPETYLRVAKETRSWKEGEVLIFDDSFEHEVWHNGTSLRLVLIVDTWHPELSSQEKKSLPPI